METEIKTIVMYDSEKNHLNFYVDGRLTSRTLFIAKMNEDFVKGNPIKLYEYEVEFTQLKGYVADMVKYSNSIMTKIKTPDSREKGAKSILRKIIEAE